MEKEIREAIVEAGRLHVDIDTVKNDDSLADLGLSSLSIVNLMNAIEDKCDITFPDEALQQKTFASINSIIDAVKQAKGMAVA